ncbi:hypothetical protein [Shimia biformata]|uniref:hypothetical protein n=1 Tax=Shimia biformata TaxID=1294299 RepID=UPI00195197FA|nr:hypothetical protein [Shimia biformata]
MKQLIAIVNVISWSGFWAFGFLALTADSLSQEQIMAAGLIAAIAFLIGVAAYLKLSKGQRINNRAMAFRHGEIDTQEG